MALFSALKRVTGSLLGASRSLSRIPGVGAIPVVGNVLSVAGGVAAASSLLGRGGAANLPALPGAGGLPALPGMGAPGIVGSRSIFRDDPNIVAALQPFAISARNLRVYHRSPVKGYVIRYDSAGDPYAIPKSLARQYLGWRPARKPPLSVGDWQAIQRADRATKKVRRIMTTISRVDKSISGGKVKISRKKKEKGG